MRFFEAFYLTIPILLVTSIINIAQKGHILPSELKTLSAIDSSYEVLQLTTDLNYDCKFYLNVNPYIEQMNCIVFTSERKGEQNLYKVDLNSGLITQITDGININGQNANVSAITQEAFYSQGSSIKAVGLVFPFSERELTKVDLTKYYIRGSINISSDGNKLLYIQLDKANKSFGWLTTIGSKDGSPPKMFYKAAGEVDHAYLNPIYGNKVLYHVLDGNISIVDTDGTNFITVGYNTSEEHVVHPFWFPDGITAAWVFKTSDKEFIETYNTRTGYKKSFTVPVTGNHFAINSTMTTFQSDGSSNKPDITYFIINPDGTLTAKKMFRHGSSSSSETWHPHAAFINSTDLVFNSDRDGNGNIYLLRKKAGPGIRSSSHIPDNKIYLLQNYPNPFNPTTKIQFVLPQSEYVKLSVYNTLGQEIAILLNQKLPDAQYSIDFDASKLNSGIYFYKLQAGYYIEAKKMVLIK